MTFLFFGFGLLLVLLVCGSIFLTASPQSLAGTARMIGPILVGIVGVVLLLAGRAGLGGMLIAAALSWYGFGRARNPRATPGRHSTVRTAALEMILDHDSGDLDGMVLVGPFEGRRLGELDVADLLTLYGNLSGDTESRQLLETYLDRRSTVWRDNIDPQDGPRQRGAPTPGGMSKEEAYQILGLQSGAAAADVRKAHRRLMQRLHPDMGGSSFLAARINEARDVLLSDHE